MTQAILDELDERRSSLAAVEQSAQEMVAMARAQVRELERACDHTFPDGESAFAQLRVRSGKVPASYRCGICGWIEER